MKCNRCGKEATHFFEMTVNGERKQLSLCSECYARYGSEAINEVQSQFTNAFSGLLSGLGGFGLFNSDTVSSLFSGAQARPQLGGAVVCSECGTPLSNYMDTGFVGCEHCYDAFKDALDKTINRLQPGARHAGKVPGGTPKEAAQNATVSDLNQKLTDAIMNGNMDEADEILEQLKAIKNAETASESKPRANAKKEGANE